MKKKMQEIIENIKIHVIQENDIILIKFTDNKLFRRFIRDEDLKKNIYLSPSTKHFLIHK